MAFPGIMRRDTGNPSVSLTVSGLQKKIEQAQLLGDYPLQHWKSAEFLAIWSEAGYSGSQEQA